MINPPQVRPEEPTAVTPHGGIRGGESQQWLSYPTKLQVRICGGGAAGDCRLYPTAWYRCEGRRLRADSAPCLIVFPSDPAGSGAAGLSATQAGSGRGWVV